jgi:hypothetical protein
LSLYFTVAGIFARDFRQLIGCRLNLSHSAQHEGPEETRTRVCKVNLRRG